MQPIQFKEVEKVDKMAFTAAKTYYDFLDGGPEKRKELCQRFLPKNECLMDWNGFQLTSPAEVETYLMNLPPTRHTMTVVDAQPLPGSVNGDSFLVTVSGTVTYNGEHKRFFFQRLVWIRGSDAKTYIAHDYMRWTGERD